MTRNGTPCEVDIRGETLFMGEDICFRALRGAREYSGYWATGPEYSVYFSDLESMVRTVTSPNFETDVTWLDLSTEAAESAGAMLDWEPHYAKVTFHGIESNRPGFYGHFGMFKRGIFMERVIKLQEINISEPSGEAPVASTESPN